MFVRDFQKLVGLLPPEVAGVADSIKEELSGTSLEGSKRRTQLLKVRDQLDGEELATSEQYHPNQYGLTAEQQEHFRKVLGRSHVNLVEPALDRLANSIHAGTVQRKTAEPLEELQTLVKAPAHSSAMARLCENAFTYGTGFLVPIATGKEIKYWLPDPVCTFLAVEPGDVSDALGIFELSSNGLGAFSALRFVTKTHVGVVYSGDRPADVMEHGLAFLPAVIAYGRDRRHRGKKYGKSLLLGVADASIRVTNNEVNLELLRDRQTQALLVVQGEATRTSTDDQGARGKYIAFPKDGGDARYETPESRIEEVIALTKRFCADAAVSSGLPLDTFLPELIAGTDASATAARIRAFPLQQRMTRLITDWQIVEETTVAVIAGVAMAAAGDYHGEVLEELRQLVRPQVLIRPSLPEAEAETLSSWQQKVTNFMAEIEEAIEHYSSHLPDERKAELAKAWRLKNDPTVANGASDELAKFKRDIAKALYSGATTKEVMANLTNLGVLVSDVGLPREAGYQEPWLPIIAEQGPVVTGGVVTDAQGDVVGGSIKEIGNSGGEAGTASPLESMAGGMPAGSGAR